MGKVHPVLVFVTLISLGGFLGSTQGSATNLNDLVKQSFLAFRQRSQGENPLHYLPEELEDFLPYAKTLTRVRPMPLNKKQQGILCTACEGLVNSVLDIFNTGVPLEDIINDVTDICIALDIVSPTECQGLIEAYAPDLEYIVQNSATDGAQFCAILLGSGCGSWEEINSWTINVPDGKPEVETPTEPESGSPITRVLQITDFHMDLTYTEGNAAQNCGQIVCCTSAVGLPAEPQDAAGHWGGYLCDTPAWTLEDMLAHIATTHTDIDYIMLTGDYPGHNLWSQSREKNLAAATLTVDLVKQAFPDTPIFPSLGNHESFPSNSFPESSVKGDFNPGWLYNGLKDMYADWLPQEALDSFAVDGFYSTEIMPGFRAIGINSLMCYNLNFWLNYNWVDPAGQLEWLVKELTQAELNGERVHILSHVPPGKDDCLGAWGREFTKIVDRFENTITGQFYGHTHNDEYTVFYDVATNSRATNIAFIAPSVTPWTDLNPAYRIYTLDGPYEGASMRVIESETYFFDLLSANAVGNATKPEYFQMYDAKTDLGMKNLFPEEWDQLARRMVTDGDLYQKFFSYFTQTTNLDDKERRDVICSLVRSSNLDVRKCEEILGPEVMEV